uniref:Sclerostin domain-containing protein 1 n=1 Tax=Castor canadensis TaxID=51338 RepID=A0A8B7WHU5_CASCN|nr:sclerostin domain-containing protein 1 isoform X2 [Castor canadensis]
MEAGISVTLDWIGTEKKAGGVSIISSCFQVHLFPRQLQEGRVQVGCRELRSTKYISDGQCTSISPLKELVCAGECLPLPVLPNWIGGGYGTKYWSRRSSQEWRCVNDKTRTQRIQLQCQDGSTRTYKITVVTACKCKRYTRQHNESSHNFESVSPAKPAQHHRERKKASKSSKHSMS